MMSNTFMFGTKNSFEEWGVKCNAYDLFIPQKRMNLIGIPGRSGRYDYGAHFYEDRVLRLECFCVRPTSKQLLRQMAYDLSGKNNITLWDEPDKHYVGQLHSSVPGLTPGDGRVAGLTLEFLCEPFAYSEIQPQPISRGVNRVGYNGTAETPCLIIIRNNGADSVVNLQISAVKRG